MTVIIGILIAVAVLYVINVGRSVVAGLLVISNSINAMAEGIKDSSDHTEERLQELYVVLDSLHSLFGGRL